MTQYAKDTQVSTSKSRMEIEKTVLRYGATGFLSGWTGEAAFVAFQLANRHIKFILPVPDINARSITHMPTRGIRRSDVAALAAYEQALRQRWRALALIIKAKLEAVESGITEIDDEFMSNIVLPDGKTVGEVMRPQIALSYQTGEMPPLLPSPKD